MDSSWRSFSGMAGYTGKKDEELQDMHMDWINRLQGAQSARSFALSVGLNPRTFQNFLYRRIIPSDAVIRIAEGLGADPVEALTATGYLDPSVRKNPVTPVSNFTMDELRDEVLRRLPTQVRPVVRAAIDAAHQVRSMKQDEM